MANLGVPIKLMHESLGHIVTVELKTGEMYRGKLMEGGRQADQVPSLITAGPLIPYAYALYIDYSRRTKRLVLFPSTAEDSLNISLREITVTARDGRVSQLEQVYIRGSMIRFVIVPDLLANAPMFKRVGPNAMRGRGIGAARGRATIQRANARRGTTRTNQGVRR
ncbi:pre-mRNA splicing factor [Dioszegia hungarica]|uniref:Small nuclear ribonucleoprotein Sm D3 n=1 Tax=Dioszegia hungarica TaxID=4972 RepID=A0AA38LW41_9TREE|nr:pre-mRNA splicing factor [Dioszegia hungarica]KAI9638010.1 pre-mRNA splicing factor [Dioszegia hungarica]